MIESTSSRVVYTVTDPSSKTFNFPYPFYQKSDLEVWISGDNGDQLLTLDVGYSVEDKASYADGANVTITGTLAAGQKIAILRVIPCVQSTDLPYHGKLDSAALESQLDRIVMMIQQLLEHVTRCLSASPTNTDVIDYSTALRQISAAVTICTTALDQLQELFARMSALEAAVGSLADRMEDL